MSKRLKTIYKNAEVLSPTYDVWISGTKLLMTKKACISSIDIKETDSGSDVATLKISDPEFLYIEDNIFLEENKIKIKTGWSNTTYRNTFDGYISAIDIEFAESGIPQITVTCMDRTHIMNRKKKSKTFQKCTRADVVKKIASSYGFKCVVDKSYKFHVQETITQSDQTDIEFIMKLAEEEVYPFSARLVGNTLYYVRKGKLGKSKMTLTYRKYPHEIISFSPKINKESKQVEINKATVSGKKVSTSKNSTEKNDGKVNSGDKPSTKATSNYTYNPETQRWNKNAK